MHSIVSRPKKRWKIYFRPEYILTRRGKQLAGIHIDGLSNSTPVCYVPQGVTLQDNFEFSAEIQFLWATAGRAAALVVFRDTDLQNPYRYVLAGDELKAFFSGIQTGQIQTTSTGFQGRFTFVKRGTALFTKPLVI